MSLVDTISRIVFGYTTKDLDELPKASSAQEALQLLRNHMTARVFVEKFDEFAARFSTPEELEAFVANKAVQFKFQDNVSDLVDHLREMADVLDKHPALVKCAYTNMSTFTNFIKNVNGGQAKNPSDVEKAETLRREFPRLSLEGAKALLKESDNDPIQAAHSYMRQTREI